MCSKFELDLQFVTSQSIKYLIDLVERHFQTWCDFSLKVSRQIQTNHLPGIQQVMPSVLSTNKKFQVYAMPSHVKIHCQREDMIS